MLKCKCVKACYYQERLWTPGETLSHNGSKAPAHFVSLAKYKPTKEPSEKEFKKSVKEGVGHSETEDLLA